MFHSKFNTVPPHIIKSIDTEIKDFIKKGKKKFIISYNTAKLPRTLGGIHAPDINLLVQSSQLTILRNLLDPNNTAEWKHLALNHINNVLDYPDLNINVLRHKNLVSGNDRDSFILYLIKLFLKLGEKVDPPNRSNITTKELLDESISTYIDSRPLHRHKITTIHEVVATMSTSGHIEISPAAELKIQYSLRRKFNKRTMDQLQDALPSRTRPPNHILYRTHDDDFELSRSHTVQTTL